MSPVPLGSAASIMSSTWSSVNFSPSTIIYCLNSGSGILPYPPQSSNLNHSISSSIVSVSLNFSSIMATRASFVKTPSLFGSAYFTKLFTSTSSTGSTSRAHIIVTSLLIFTTSVPSSIKISQRALMSAITSGFKICSFPSSGAISIKF